MNQPYYYQYQQYMYQQRMRAKQLRRTFNPIGWTLVVYYLIMNITVAVVMVVDIMAQVFQMMAVDPDMDMTSGMDALMDAAMESGGWGYLLSAAIGLFVLLVWKGKDFWKQQIFAKGRPMKPGDFFLILCIFMGIQLLASLMSSVLEMILNKFGLSMMSVLESASGQSSGLSMFIYASICAPITEELLFRGYVQRTLMPYGKKFAIFCSAVLFGLFHGNLIQTPYAFAVGLVLGYVAVEYNVVWAMVLHMLNNMVLADLLTRVSSAIAPGQEDMISGLVILAFGIAAVVVLIVKRKRIAAYLRQERMDRQCLKSFFGNAGVITLTVLMLSNLLLLITAI